MARTSNVFARIEPDLKEQAEQVLDQLGIPMSSAIGMFLRQVVIQQGIPFDMKLPREKPASLGELDDEGLDELLERGYSDVVAGRMHRAKDVFDELRRDYGI